MKRYLIEILLIITGYLLQSTFFQALSLGGIVPNLLIIITSCFGFMRGKNEGMAIGFISGLLMDIFFGSFIGLYALVYMFIGYLNGFFRSVFYPEDIKLPLALISASELLCSVLCYIFLFLLRGRTLFGFYFVHIILPEIVYTILATLIFYKGILFINEWLEINEKRSAV